MKMSLFSISKLAKENPKKAAEELLVFIKENFPEIEAQSVSINDSKVSLNSVNGFIQMKRKEYFFKFHAEEGEEVSLKESEYYNARVLKNAGYPMVEALFMKTEPGSQFVIYPKIEASTVFEELEKLEKNYVNTGNYNKKNKKELLESEKDVLELQGKVYLASLAVSDAKTLKNSSIFQLFTHRLNGVKGHTSRVDLFYSDKDFELPGGEKINSEDFKKLKWTINGVSYSENIEGIIKSAKQILKPKGEKIPVVLGHGDDHNGNKFYIGGKFLFFDPAFAGQHPALLSFIKATAHNTFLHPFWLYDSNQVNDIDLKYSISENEISIEHNLGFPESSPIRSEILDMQIEYVWRPLIIKLRMEKLLPENYKEYIRKALFCCPFLVYNLADYSKFSHVSSFLALSKCVELGSEGDKKNYVDDFLDKISDL